MQYDVPKIQIKVRRIKFIIVQNLLYKELLYKNVSKLSIYSSIKTKFIDYIDNMRQVFFYFLSSSTCPYYIKLNFLLYGPHKRDWKRKHSITPKLVNTHRRLFHSTFLFLHQNFPFFEGLWFFFWEQGSLRTHIYYKIPLPPSTAIAMTRRLLLQSVFGSLRIYATVMVAFLIVIWWTAHGQYKQEGIK